MAEYHFYMKRVTQDAGGTRRKESKEYDLEKDFAGLKYKSLSGANAYGKPKGVYAESFAEDPAMQVFVDGDGERAQTDITLSVYFLDPRKYGASGTGSTPYARMSALYHSFVEFLANRRIIYHDDARGRYLYLYMEDAHTLPADKLIGLQYIEAQFKFKNIYGKSFASESEITL